MLREEQGGRGDSEVTSGGWTGPQVHALHESQGSQVGRGRKGAHAGEVQRASGRDSWLTRESWPQLGELEGLAQGDVARLPGPEDILALWALVRS